MKVWILLAAFALSAGCREDSPGPQICAASAPEVTPVAEGTFLLPVVIYVPPGRWLNYRGNEERVLLAPVLAFVPVSLSFPAVVGPTESLPQEDGSWSGSPTGSASFALGVEPDPSPSLSF